MYDLGLGMQFSFRGLGMIFSDDENLRVAMIAEMISKKINDAKTISSI
tara:strand:+ start:395 stop:538 length:144 start_codon:yes stop_codon:yes gene_type:complete